MFAEKRVSRTDGCLLQSSGYHQPTKCESRPLLATQYSMSIKPLYVNIVTVSKRLPLSSCATALEPARSGSLKSVSEGGSVALRSPVAYDSIVRRHGQCTRLHTIETTLLCSRAHPHRSGQTRRSVCSQLFALFYAPFTIYSVTGG